MKDYLYVIYALVLGTVSLFTGELVTFLMLGIVLMALHNMLRVQKEILRKLDKTKTDNFDEQS